MKKSTKIILGVTGAVVGVGVAITVYAVVSAPSQQGPEGALRPNPLEALGRFLGVAANAAQNYRNERDGGGAPAARDPGLVDTGMERGSGREGMMQV